MRTSHPEVSTSQSGSGWWLRRAPDLPESFRLAGKAAAGQGTRVILGYGHAGQLPAASGAVPRGRATLSACAEQRRPQRAGRQLAQGLVHLPGHQVLDLDRAELTDRMIGKTSAIPCGAGLPHRGSVVEPVPDPGRHRAGSGDAKPGYARSRMQIIRRCAGPLPLRPAAALRRRPACRC
jgi:hypothetical protein